MAMYKIAYYSDNGGKQYLVRIQQEVDAKYSVSFKKAEDSISIKGFEIGSNFNTVKIAEKFVQEFTNELGLSEVKINEDEKDLTITTNYSISSRLDDTEMERYCVEISGQLFHEFDEGKVLIGQFRGYQINADQAQLEGFSLLDLYDITSEIAELGSTIINFKTNEFKKPIEDFLDDSYSENVFYLSRIEILPKYQGLGLSGKWFKEIIQYFGNNCTLIVGKSFPLQLEGAESESKNYSFWDLKMGYDKKSKNEKEVKAKLLKHYLKLGFKNIPKISKDYIFINPAEDSPFDEIDF